METSEGVTFFTPDGNLMGEEDVAAMLNKNTHPLYAALTNRRIVRRENKGQFIKAAGIVKMACCPVDGKDIARSLNRMNVVLSPQQLSKRKVAMGEPWVSK